jgi:hypothetical protein
MILNPFGGSEQVRREQAKPHMEVPQFLEGLDLELNFGPFPALFSLFAEFKERFPGLNISLSELFKIVKEYKDFFREVYYSLLEPYLKGKIA